MLCVLVVSKGERECPCLRRVDMRHNYVMRGMLSLQEIYQKKDDKDAGRKPKRGRGEGDR